MTLSTPVGNASAATTCTIPTHAVGDLIVIYSYKDGGTTPPVKPTASGTVPAWVTIDANTGANTNASATYYFKATATNHTSGTWAGATLTLAVVLSGQDPTTPIGAHSEWGATANAFATAPNLDTLTKTDGTSVILHFYGHRTITSWSAAPSGYTRVVAVATEGCCNSKDVTTTCPSIAQAGTGTNSGYRGASVEILAASGPPVGKITAALQAVNRVASY